MDMLVMQNIIECARAIRDSLPGVEGNVIDYSLLPVPPYCGGEDVRVIVVGQDPTIRRAEGRGSIRCTLNLDREGVLRGYIERICQGLHISMDNVYATNVYKYFYSIPPADTPGVLPAHLEPNVALLRRELGVWHDCPVITLGEPVLRLLAGCQQRVRHFWDYRGCGFHYVAAEDNVLHRCIFPFPHQPSMRKLLYKQNFAGYVAYMRRMMGVV